MTAKEIFESIDLSQLPKEAADKFRKVEKATKGFTIESDKVNTFMRGAYKKIKETKPTALKNLKVEEKIIKKEVKKGKTTEVVENLEYKVKGTKKVDKKTPTPSKPKRSGETAMERAKKIRKKLANGKLEPWKDAFARAQKELKAEAAKAKKDAEKVVSTTSQALKNLEKMIQNDPKLKGYPRTYGKQSKRIDANKDAKIKAKPAGKRVSKKGHKNQYGESKGGRVYWENRDNRSDRYAPNFPNKVYLEMGGETDDLGFPTGHTFLVVEVSPDGTKNLIKSTKDYMTALMSSAVARGMKSNKDARVVIVDKEDKKVIHEAFEAGGEITITPTQIINNPDYLVGTTTMTELFEAGGCTAYQEGGEVFVTQNPLLNAGSGDYVAGSNTMSNMFRDGGFIAMYNGKRVEIEAETLLDAKKKAIQELKVPKSKQGLLSVMSNQSMQNEDFRFMAKGGKLPKNIKYYGVNEIKEYRLKNGDKIDPSQTFVDSGIYVSATKTMKPKEKEFQQKLEFASGGKINWKEDYDYIPRYNIEEVELENGKVIKGDYVVSGIYKPKSNRTKQLEKEMKARMKKMETGGKINADDIEFANEENEAIGKFLLTTSEGKEIWNSSSNRNEFEKKIRAYHSSKGLPNWMFDDGDDDGIDWATFGDLWSNKELKQAMKKMESGGTIVAADPSAAMEDLNQTYGFESVYEKGGTTPENIQRMQEKLINDLWDRKGYDISYLAELPIKQLKSLYDTEFYYEDEFEKGGRLGFEGLAKKVAKRYEGKAVKPKFQEEYGKTYSKEEAMEVGRKVAAKVYGQQQANMKKMAKGGYLVRFEDEGKYETKKFATLDEAKDFYNFISEQKMNYGPQKTQLVSNEDGKVLMGSSELPQLAKGGSLMGHGLQIGDKIVKDLGSILQVTTKDGGMVYVDLANGYRGAEMPLPFEKGGAVGEMKIPDIAKKFGKTTADVIKQVEIGAKHEMEHTSDAKKARKIALDHLSGDLDYYTKLKKLGL